MDVDQVLVTHPPLAPHSVDKRSTGEDHSRTMRQCREDIELGACQRDGLVPEEDLTPVEVKLEVSEPEALGGRANGRRSTWTSEHHGDARHQLSGTERFGHVVISPDRQPDQHVDLVGTCGEHDDVAVGEHAQLTTDLNSVHTGQAQVEHDHIRVDGASKFQPTRAVVREVHLKAALAQVAAHELGKRAFVIDDQSPPNAQSCICTHDHHCAVARSPPAPGHPDTSHLHQTLIRTRPGTCCWAPRMVGTSAQTNRGDHVTTPTAPALTVTVVTANACHHCHDAIDVLMKNAVSYQIDVREVPSSCAEGRELIATHRPPMSPLVLINGEYFSSGRLPRKKLRDYLNAHATPVVVDSELDPQAAGHHG